MRGPAHVGRRRLASRCALFLFLLLWCGGLACGDDGDDDEARLEQFVHDVTGRVDEGLADRALGYTDFERLPVDVRAPGHAGVYRADRAPVIEAAFRRGLRQHLWQSELRVRSSTIEIDGTHARVGMRLMSQRGPLRVDTELDKLDGAWKLVMVRLERGF